MKNALNLKALGVAVFCGITFMLAGCKSAPELTKANALAMIQAKYDQSPAESISITVNDLGLREGITAKYWGLSKIYPNKYWADYTLTPDGKKLVKTASGGDAIEWRPDSMEDKNHTVVITTVAMTHPKARDMKDLQDEGETKTVEFNETVNFEGLPDALSGIGHNPGNKLTTKRTASFVLDGGAWKLQSIS